jgi:hypothetical protein
LPEDGDNNFSEIFSSWKRWAMSEVPVTSIEMHGRLNHAKFYVFFLYIPVDRSLLITVTITVLDKIQDCRRN